MRLTLVVMLIATVAFVVAPGCDSDGDSDADSDATPTWKWTGTATATVMLT
jgi:hypothetical protein